MDDTTNTTASTSAQNGAQDTGATGTTAGTTSTPNTAQEPAKGTQSVDKLDELIQKAVDRATNKLGNENKNLRKQVEDLQKAKLSDEQLKQLELQEKEKEISEREQRLLEKENRLLAIKAIKEIGLDDGSDASLELVDFVMGEDEDTIRARVKSFDALVKRFVKAEVDKVFKTNGRTPGVGNTAATEDSKKDHVAVRIGQNAAKANKAAQSTLDYYTGGKKA